MKRFFDEEGIPEDFFSNEEGEEEYGEGYMDKEEVRRAMELDDKDINQKILFQTIKMLGTNEPKWSTKTMGAKIKLITKTYSYFLGMVETQIEE